MKHAEPTIEQWRSAYELAAAIRELEPWTWMYDMDHFAFRDPEDGSPRFVSVMGREGTHHAVAVYRRVEDLFRIIDLVRDPGEVHDGLLEISQLQLSFEDRAFLAPEDRHVIKRLGLKFRGKHAWPWFRSYLPGQYPWFLDRHELQLLTVALKQVLTVTPRFRDNGDELEQLNHLGMKEGVFLMRTLVNTAETEEWEESLVRVDRPRLREVAPDHAILERVSRFPVAENSFEIELRAAPEPIQERKGQRPCLPWVMLIVESADGYIAGHELLMPVPDLDAVYRRAPQALLEVLEKYEIRPAEIFVRTERLAALFRSMCRSLDMTLTVRPSLPRAEDAFTSLLRFTG